MSRLMFVLALLASPALAEETIYLERTLVEGSEALPRVLYLQPWSPVPETPAVAPVLPGPQAEIPSHQVGVRPQ